MSFVISVIAMWST